MREITLSYKQICEALTNNHGMNICFPVRVNWPELRLSEAQIVANSFAIAYGQERPYPDNSLFNVKIVR